MTEFFPYRYEKKKSILEKLSLKEEEAISEDFFRYSCIEEQKTYKYLDVRNRSREWFSYPQLDELTVQLKKALVDAKVTEQPETSSGQDASDQVEAASDQIQAQATHTARTKNQQVKVAIEQLLNWYAHSFAWPKANDTYNFAMHSECLPSVLGFVEDAKKLWNLSERPAHEFNDVIDQNSIFMGYLSRYVVWLLDEGLIPDQIPLSSIPPQGRYIPLHEKTRRSALAQQRRRNPRPGQNIGRNQDSYEPVRAQKDAAEVKRSKPEVSVDAEQPRLKEESQAHVIEEALQEAKEASSALKQDPTLQEVKLSPRNSYLRRLQHQAATEAGFDTESVGEGNQRAILIRVPR